MMRKKIMLLSMTAVLAVPMLVGTIGMQKVEAAQTQQICEVLTSDEGIVPLADVIVTKYRSNNGKIEYRRWNETKGRWVDSDWIPLN